MLSIEGVKVDNPLQIPNRILLNFNINSAFRFNGNIFFLILSYQNFFKLSTLLQRFEN